MNENQKAAKQCVRDYYSEDKFVMIDKSIMRIKGIMFYIYDLIYFGNKIIISKETLTWLKNKKRATTFRMLAENISYLLEAIQNDEYENYQIVDIENYGATHIQRITKYLKENINIIYLLENKKLYEGFIRDGINTQLKLLNTKMKVTSLCKNKAVRFETLGILNQDNEKMFIKKYPEDTLVKIYNFSGEEKEGNEVDVNDIILIRSDKNVKSCYNLYWIVSRHSRHQSIKIIWTDIQKGDKTNFYVERLEEKYKKIIKENIPT